MVLYPSITVPATATSQL